MVSPILRVVGRPVATPVCGCGLAPASSACLRCVSEMCTPNREELESKRTGKGKGGKGKGGGTRRRRRRSAAAADAPPGYYYLSLVRMYM